jgi:creatinine amidohydrolase
MEDPMELMYRPWPDTDAARARTDLLIVPTGAVEVYGPHLPTGTDTIVIGHIARLVAQELDAVVLPAVPVGFSQSLNDFPGTLWVSTEAFARYLREMVESALPWGFRRVLFLNSHRGNVGPVSEVAMTLQERHGARCAQVFWWDYVAALSQDLVETSALANGHAAEIGTSIMLHLAPELVVRERIASATPAAAPSAYPDIAQYRGMQPRSATGVTGNPVPATPEKGAEMVRRGVARIVAFVLEEFEQAMSEE